MLKLEFAKERKSCVFIVYERWSNNEKIFVELRLQDFAQTTKLGKERNFVVCILVFESSSKHEKNFARFRWQSLSLT